MTRMMTGCTLAIAIVGGAAHADVRTISGAGATFPYPLYSKWAHAYQQKTGVELNYQAIGSGGGIKQIKAGTVDFGASDAPLEGEELKQAGLIQFPMIMGGVVPVVHIEGVKPGQLKLDGEVLAAIYLGEIIDWSDSRIKKLNPGLDLPEKGITTVHRADGSGTTFIFTNYLSKVSDTWRKEIGSAKAVPWPVGVGSKGNQGVASYVERIDGAIGYVEYAYALQNGMSYTQLRNQAGNFVLPTEETFAAAAAGADWENAPDFYMILTNQPGARSWPITGASFILVHSKPSDTAKLQAILKFFDWAYRNGDRMAAELHYVPIPSSVVERVETTWRERITGNDGKPAWDGGPHG